MISIAEPPVGNRINAALSDAYARELGTDSFNLPAHPKELYRSALRDYFREAFSRNYKGEVEVDGKRIALIELPPEYIPRNVLGMTDCFSAIWLRSDLNEKFGYAARERVLEHEKEHVRDPLASEQEVRRRTNTERIGAYSLN
jgi:hypothetical protein